MLFDDDAWPGHLPEITESSSSEGPANESYRLAQGKVLSECYSALVDQKKKLELVDLPSASIDFRGLNEAVWLRMPAS